MQVAIRELKNHFSKYLKKVQTGTEIIITTHGKPIARFSHLDISDDISSENTLQNLSWVQKSVGGKPVGLSNNQRIRLNSGKSLSDMLLEDRE